QIVDDILDAAEAHTADGRKDKELAKATYPAILGLEGARKSAAREHAAALSALRLLGPKAEPLRAIATHIITRPELSASSGSGSAGRGFAAPRTPRAPARARASTAEPPAWAGGDGGPGASEERSARQRASTARAPGSD